MRRYHNEDVMQPIRTVLVVSCLLICLMFASAGNADRIYLKDGTVVVSDKVWQSRDHVHFILQGTQNVEIRYDKEIVAKIESDGKTLKPNSPAMPQVPSTPPPAAAKTVKKAPKVVNKTTMTAGKDSPSKPSMAPAAGNATASTRGLSFYDPRREKRYWASRNSRHETLDGALQALAKQYDRTPQWVASHMGEVNNLSEIHANLTKTRESETSINKSPRTNQPSEHRRFYDSGREYPYHIGPDQNFKTRKAALEALANQYQHRVEWVNRHIGDHTDLDEIHRILTRAASEKSAKVPQSIGSEVRQESASASLDGLEFYNPRREQKYWTGKMERYNTLKEALMALAKQYGVSTDWIEANMGNTNDLATIHRNIRKSLQ